MLSEQARRLLQAAALKADPNAGIYFVFETIIRIPLKSRHRDTLLVCHRLGHYILNYEFAIFFRKLVASFVLLSFLAWAALSRS